MLGWRDVTEPGHFAVRAIELRNACVVRMRCAGRTRRTWAAIFRENVVRPVFSYPLALVTLFHICLPAAGQALDQVTFRFGEASIVVERPIILSQPSPFQYSVEDWEHATQYDMRPEQFLYLELPAASSIPASSACGRAPVVALRLSALPPRGSPVEFKRGGWQASPTSNRGISRLIPPPNSASIEADLYEFESDELRDAWGNKQAFFIRGVVALAMIQITREIQILLDRRADSCFFANGEGLVRYVRDFVAERIKLN